MNATSGTLAFFAPKAIHSNLVLQGQTGWYIMKAVKNTNFSWQIKPRKGLNERKIQF